MPSVLQSTDASQEDHLAYKLAQLDVDPSSSAEPAEAPNSDDDEARSFHTAGDEEEQGREGAWEEETPQFTEAEIRDLVSRASSLKSQGNAHFVAGRYADAVPLYEDALAHVPKRPRTPSPSRSPSPSPAPEVEEGVEEIPRDPREFVANPPGKVGAEAGGVEEECKEMRKTLRGNLAACWVKLEEWKKAVDACTEALKDDTDYIKALQRRALASERLGTWSSLQTALSDCQRLLTFSPSDRTARAAIARLPRLVQEAQEREKAEMLGKLKDLGNSVLGRFGLSTDNFKFVPDGKGGYSMNFQR